MKVIDRRVDKTTPAEPYDYVIDEQGNTFVADKDRLLHRVAVTEKLSSIAGVKYEMPVIQSDCFKPFVPKWLQNPITPEMFWGSGPAQDNKDVVRIKIRKTKPKFNFNN